MSLLYDPDYQFNRQAQAPGFSSLFRFLDDFDQFSQQATRYSPRFDLVEHDKSYELHGELPGMRKRDINIEFVDDQTLTVGGQAQRTYEAGNNPPAGSLPGQPQREAVEEGGRRGGAAAERQPGQTGQSAQDAESAAQKYWVSERSFGQFSRVFKFPSRVDPNEVEARFNDGLLTVTVPKAEKKQSRRVTLIE